MTSFWAHISEWSHTQLSDPWFLLGFFGQALFTARFFVQWLYSEKMKQSIVPDIFWYFSLSGSTLVLVYAIHLENLVFILGQCGIIVYIRNIQLIWKQKKHKASLNLTADQPMHEA